jgi:membrane-bound lytic murein transglycosylase D
MRPPQMSQREQPPDARSLNVRLPEGNVLRFRTDFYIGRDPGCEVCVEDAHASRRHAQVSFARGQWSIRDLQSSNGLFVDGERVESAPIGEGISVRLGKDGPLLQMGPRLQAVAPPEEVEEEPDEDSMVDGYAERYFGADAEESDENVGGRTQMIRRAYKKVQQKQRRQQRWVIAIVALLVIGVAGYVVHLRSELRKRQDEARKFFYDMKAVDVIIAGIQEELLRPGNAVSPDKIRALEDQRRELERRYEEVAARVYGRPLSEKERLILRVTRTFGECEIAAPSAYVREVTRFIDQWRSTKRFEQGIRRAQQNGYPRRIVTALMARQVPVQFFYLALQESDFIPTRSGPPTRFGIAKGMWQFIPDTGRQYGLQPGPYYREARIDPEDERLNWEKATSAAASYIKDIYATDAQASGLLVMASYNWGERRVVERLKKLPMNPRERNFWNLLAHYRDDVPDQTYNYVFSIVSAAVIGENPRLFGIPLDNPLAFTAPSR